jgi:hypothetical protein
MGAQRAESEHRPLADGLIRGVVGDVDGLDGETVAVSPIWLEDRALTALAALEDVVIADKLSPTATQAAIGSGFVRNMSRCRTHGDLRVNSLYPHP